MTNRFQYPFCNITWEESVARSWLKANPSQPTSLLVLKASIHVWHPQNHPMWNFPPSSQQLRSCVKSHKLWSMHIRDLHFSHPISPAVILSTFQNIPSPYHCSAPRLIVALPGCCWSEFVPATVDSSRTVWNWGLNFQVGHNQSRPECIPLMRTKRTCLNRTDLQEISPSIFI